MSFRYKSCRNLPKLTEILWQSTSKRRNLLITIISKLVCQIYLRSNFLGTCWLIQWILKTSLPAESVCMISIIISSGKVSQSASAFQVSADVFSTLMKGQQKSCMPNLVCLKIVGDAGTCFMTSTFLLICNLFLLSLPYVDMVSKCKTFAFSLFIAQMLMLWSCQGCFLSLLTKLNVLLPNILFSYANLQENV